ncbi:MAG TPA: hypothetical protein VMD79_01900 [Solirubrobacteraceae bacterium]|nr:hypothetical protein [Solirubrobacteraceae bacterium]
MHKLRSIERPLDAFMLALLALALPVAGYELRGFMGLAVGLGLALMAQDAVPHRFDAVLERQPRWCWYVAAVVIVCVVGAATGHSTEATTDNATFVIVLLAIEDTIKWLSNRRQRRRLDARG